MKPPFQPEAIFEAHAGKISEAGAVALASLTREGKEMLVQNFREEIESGRGGVVICAGSQSDAPHIEQICRALDAYGIAHEVRICSAHKQPEQLMQLIAAYNQIQKPLAFIAVAGGTDALSGTLSYHAMAPVISCPPDAPNATCLTNPPGSSNATAWLPKNAARFVAQMFCPVNPELRGRLREEMNQKIALLRRADESYRKEGDSE